MLFRAVLPALFLLPAAYAQENWKVLDPQKSQHLVESEHFVARWNEADGVKLTEPDLHKGLAGLENIWRFYIETLGFPAPKDPYKVDIFVSNKGWANGSGTGVRHPAMWVHYKAFGSQETLAHEFAHTLQYTSQGMRDSKYVGWFWECHAEWMTHQMFPEQAGCSQQLVNAPHLYYGSTRDRYGCWQFWEFLKDTHGYPVIHRIWTDSRRSDDPRRSEEDPIEVLGRNEKWSIEELSDQFGSWAMHNVTWDYKTGPALRRHYGSYDDERPESRHRVSLLKPVMGRADQYVIPDYHAPQRYGYNLVRLEPTAGHLEVCFQGLVQKEAGVTTFSGKFANEPESVPAPDSSWRWGLVAVGADGLPRYSPLQRGVEGRLSWDVRPGDREQWLVVMATPRSYQKIQWDQVYYSIYRYPWSVEIKGARPASVRRPTGRVGAAHPNGGGWVDATAKVAAGAYVGSTAQVLEQAQVLGHARVEGEAVISGQAILSDEAQIRDQVLLTGKARVGGRAQLSDEAAVYEGRIDEEASVGALTVVAGNKTHIHGRAIVRGVMNVLHNADLSGTVQLLGDLELHTPLSSGVFYGFVTPEMAKDPRFGAQRSAPEKEVTAP